MTIKNLENISVRLEFRITKSEGENRVMTDAKTLLEIAKDKLAKAKNDVAQFQSITISHATSTSLTTQIETQVDLAKPRALGDVAIKSVKEARDAFKKVLDAIAHAMGIGVNASTTINSKVETN